MARKDAICISNDHIRAEELLPNGERPPKICLNIRLESFSYKELRVDLEERSWLLTFVPLLQLSRIAPEQCYLTIRIERADTHETL